MFPKNLSHLTCFSPTVDFQSIYSKFPVKKQTFFFIFQNSARLQVTSLVPLPSEQRLRLSRWHRVRPQVRHLEGGRDPKVETFLSRLRLSLLCTKFGPLDKDLFRRVALLYRADNRRGDPQGRVLLPDGWKFSRRIYSGFEIIFISRNKECQELT